MSAYETDLVPYNPRYSKLNLLNTGNGVEADILRRQMTLNLLTTIVSVHKRVSDVPDGQWDSN